MRKAFAYVLAIVCLVATMSCSGEGSQESLDSPLESPSSFDSADVQSCLPFESTDSDTHVCPEYHRNYVVYQNYFGSITVYEDSFNKTMLDNPIDKKMNEEISVVYSSGTREAQVFLSEYALLWRDELGYSIDNLKEYLSEEDQANLDIAQKAWEDSLKLNREFDQALMGSRGIGLGTQYVSSNLFYGIDQYRDRVFHIKYMTYLAETNVQDRVPENERLWYLFLEI